jgi:beta-phosphoglucomutase
MSHERVAAVFDMDGVLIDSYDAHFQTWQQALAERGVEFKDSQFASFFGRTSRESIPAIWPHAPLSDEEIAALESRKEAAFRDLVRDHFPIMDGARELLAALRSSHFLIAVASSGPPENVNLCVEKIGKQYFDAVVTGADVTRGKPDPEVFLCAASSLRLPPTRCVVLEDAPAGIEAAHAAGMRCIGLVSTGRTSELLAKAELVVRSLREVSPETMTRLIGH